MMRDPAESTDTDPRLAIDGVPGVASPGARASPGAGASRRPRLAVTLGDPRGIGPEIVAAVLADTALSSRAELVVVGPSGCDLTADVAIGHWRRGSTEQDAGRLSGLAIERAVAMAQAGDVQG